MVEGKLQIKPNIFFALFFALCFALCCVLATERGNFIIIISPLHNNSGHASSTSLADACVLYPGIDESVQHGLHLVPAMWITQYPSSVWHTNFQTCVYQRHNEYAPAFVFNRGYEAGIYLRYVIDHYFSLPDIVAFVQEDASVEIGNRIACLRNDTDWGWAPLHTQFISDRDLTIWRQEGFADATHACWSGLASDFNVSISLTSDPVVSFYSGAYFAVTRQALLRNTRAAYASAYARIVLADKCSSDKVWQGRPITNFGTSKGTSAGAFEHLQHVLIGGNPLQMAPYSQFDWCGRFVPNSRCYGSPCVR